MVTMIELTVGLPLYKAKHIAWLALESLSRQKDVDFEWELLIIEEQQECFGQEAIYKYKDKLPKCVRFEYIPLNSWITLGQKWHILALIASQNSECFVLQAADDYSQPWRLKETIELFKAKALWIQNRYGIYYDFILEKTLLYDWKNSVPQVPTALEKAIKTSLLYGLPNEQIRDGVDGWLYQQCKKIEPEIKPVFNESKNWKHGIITQGANIISKTWSTIKDLPPCFIDIDININSYIPSDIIERLKKTKDEISNNKEK